MAYMISSSERCFALRGAWIALPTTATAGGLVEVLSWGIRHFSLYLVSSCVLVFPVAPVRDGAFEADINPPRGANNKPCRSPKTNEKFLRLAIRSLLSWLAAGSGEGAHGAPFPAAQRFGQIGLRGRRAFRIDRLRLAVLPLHDDELGAGAAALVVELDAAAGEVFAPGRRCTSMARIASATFLRIGGLRASPARP